MRHTARRLIAAAALAAATTAAASANGIAVPAGGSGGTCGVANPNVARFANYCGARVTITGGDTTPAYVQDDSPSGATTYNVRFYVNARALTMANGDAFDLFAAYSGAEQPAGSPAGTAVLRVVVDQSAGVKRLTLFTRHGGGETATPAVALQPGWRSVEASWTRGAGTGTLSWWLNGAAQSGLAGLANDTVAVEYARWGAVAGLEGTTSGSFSLDDFASQLSGKIGPAAPFTDNPTDSPFYPFMQGIYAAEVIPGSSVTTFTPTGNITRKEMAQFVLKARYGSGFTPPACVTQRFGDVPCSHPYAAWINEFAAQGITAGCVPDPDGGGPGLAQYCPEGTINRAEMSVFLVAAAGFATQPCPPSAFSDVAVNSPFCPFINEIAARGITAGCGGGAFCQTLAVTRSQMSVFMLTTFDDINLELQQHLP